MHSYEPPQYPNKSPENIVFTLSFYMDGTGIKKW